MGIFLGMLITYFSLGYAMLKREMDAGVTGQTPLVRNRQYMLYVLIWPLPLLVNTVLIDLYVRQRDKELASQKANETIQAFRDSFGYAQPESILMALWTIATKFKTVKADPSEVLYIERIKKSFGIIPVEDEIYQQMMSGSRGNDFMIYLNQMSDQHKNFLCVLINEMLEGQPRKDPDKANVALPILSDININKQQYTIAIAEGNPLLSSRHTLK